jgi:hypothetical protein
LQNLSDDDAQGDDRGDEMYVDPIVSAGQATSAEVAYAPDVTVLDNTSMGRSHRPLTLTRQDYELLRALYKQLRFVSSVVQRLLNEF